MRHLPSDLRVSLRLLLRHPGFTLLAVLILALGIGSSTAIYSVVRGVVLKPLPFPDSEELVQIREVREGQAQAVGLPTYLDWRGAQRGLSSLAVFLEDAKVLTDPSLPRTLASTLVSRDFFRTLEVPFSRGRAFTTQEHRPGGERVVIVSHDLWVGLTGGETFDLAAATLRLDDESYRVVAVAPAEFDFPTGTDVWLPLLAEAPQFQEVRGARIFYAFGRLAPGVEPRAAEEELTGISAAPAVNGAGWSAEVRPLRRAMAGDSPGALFMLLGAVLFVLLVACANVANLSIARGLAREREIGVRRVLGAGGGRIVSLILSESLLLAVAAGGLGVLLAYWSLDLILLLVPSELPRAGEIRVDGGVLGFAVMLSAVTGLVSGLAPAFRSARPGLVLRFKDGGSGIAGRMGARGLRSALVATEVALTVLLLAGAGLLGRSFMRITDVDPGFRPANVLVFSVNLPEHRYPEEAQWRAFFRDLEDNLQSVPGVVSVGLSRNLPVSGRSMMSPVRIEGREPREGETREFVQVSTVSPGFFTTMGTPLVEGRSFTAGDRTGSPPVAMVSEAFVRTFLAAESALGRRAHTFFGDRVMRDIVGVVGDVHHRGPTHQAPPTFYVPSDQDPLRGFAVVLRTEDDPEAVVTFVRGVLARLDPLLPMDQVTTMTGLLSQSVAGPRFYAVTLGAFAILALLVAAVGLYGVMATSVASRSREMGIRFAVGAGHNEVVGMVLREALLLTSVGVSLGLAAGLGVGHLLEGVLFQMSGSDPVSLVAGAGFALVTAMLATWVPARRAARINPVDVLRS